MGEKKEKKKKNATESPSSICLLCIKLFWTVDEDFSKQVQLFSYRSEWWFSYYHIVVWFFVPAGSFIVMSIKTAAAIFAYAEVVSTAAGRCVTGHSFTSSERPWNSIRKWYVRDASKFWFPYRPLRAQVRGCKNFSIS